MKILITGASGFIGKNFLLNSKFSKNNDIDALYFNDTAFSDFIKKNKIKADIIKCDLTSEEQVQNTFGSKNKAKDYKDKKKEYDVCLYLAANSDPRYSVTHPIDDLNRNVMALLNVLQNIKCKKFIFFSSGAVYHGLKGLVSPKSRLSPSLPYSISKLTCEKYVKFFKDNGTIQNFTIIRFFGAFGPYEPDRKITTKLIKQSVMNNEKEYTIYGNGKNLIDLMYIEDTIKGIDAVIDNNNGDNAVDFGTGSPMSIIDMINKFSIIIDKKVRITKKGMSEENISFRISSKEFCKSFRFKFAVSFEVGIKKLIEHLKNSGKGE